MKAKAGDPEYQDYYFCYDDRTIPDEYERTTPQVFPNTAPGNFSWCDEMHKWVLTSFYPFQWDLNYRNPKVLVAMLTSALNLANLGVEVLRIDAVPYIWKQLGTTSRNLPQVHTIVRMLRIALECVCPAVVLKGEVVIAPKELAAYFGTPEHPECHMLYKRLHDGQPVERARQRRHPPAQGADRRVGRPARELLVRQLPALP